MTWTRRQRTWGVFGALLLVWLAVDQPWTVRPMDSQPPAGAPLDAARYVDDIWPARVVTTLEGAAVDVAQMADAARAVAGAGAGPAAIRLMGVILSVDTSSRAGVALVDVDPADGRADAALQVGPVIRGTALRDALGFIRFTDFTNQLEYAAVAGALNDRVLAEVLAPVDLATLDGRRVQVLGAAAPGAGPNGLPAIVPVRLDLEDAP